MIFVGLGGNLPGTAGEPPRATLEQALAALDRAPGIRVLARSRWYRTRPVPESDQPWFVNGVAALAATIEPAALLDLLHRTEAELGRVRRQRDEARPLDLDLLAWHDRIAEPRSGMPGLVLPHPRLHCRRFVLQPLADLAPDWRHPVSGRSVRELLAALGPEVQPAEALAD